MDDEELNSDDDEGARNGSDDIEPEIEEERQYVYMSVGLSRHPVPQPGDNEVSCHGCCCRPYRSLAPLKDIILTTPCN